MLTVITINENDSTFEVRETEATAIGTEDNQFVLEGSPTDEEIIDYANEFMAAPYDGFGDYNGWMVIR